MVCENTIFWANMYILYIYILKCDFFRGDDETVLELNAKIQELEERASQLDKTRTSSIQSISYINNRNRKLNVETAEKAIMEEVSHINLWIICPQWCYHHIIIVLKSTVTLINVTMFILKVKAMKGKKTDDPFTRRHTKPVMNFKSGGSKPSVS